MITTSEKVMITTSDINTILGIKENFQLHVQKSI